MQKLNGETRAKGMVWPVFGFKTAGQTELEECRHKVRLFTLHEVAKSRT